MAGQAFRTYSDRGLQGCRAPPPPGRSGGDFEKHLDDVVGGRRPGLAPARHAGHERGELARGDAVHAAQLGDGIGVLVDPQVDAAIVLVADDGQGRRLPAALVAADGLRRLERPHQPFVERLVDSRREGGRHCLQHLRAGQHVALHGIVRRRALPAPAGAPRARPGRAVTLRADDAELAELGRRILGHGAPDGLCGARAGGHRVEEPQRQIRVHPGLGADGADARPHVKADGADGRHG